MKTEKTILEGIKKIQNLKHMVVEQITQIFAGILIRKMFVLLCVRTQYAKDHRLLGKNSIIN